MPFFENWPGLPFPLLPMTEINAAIPTYFATTMDASGEGAGWVIQAPRTGNIKRAGFRLATVSNVPDNGLRFALQSLSAGLPLAETHFRTVTTGLTTNAWVETGIISSDGTDTGTLKAVTAGDALAATLDFQNFVASDSIQINYAIRNVFDGQGFTPGFPYLIRDVGAGWAKVTGGTGDVLIFALQYDDDVWYPIFGCAPITSTTAYTATNITEFALKLTLPIPLRVRGLKFKSAFDPTSTLGATLYDSSTVSLVTSSVSGALSGAGAAISVYTFGFPSSVEMARDLAYRLAIRGTTGLGTLGLYYMSAPSVAYMNAMPLGTAGIVSTRTYPGGAWTDITTATPLLCPMIDGIDPTKDLPQFWDSTAFVRQE